jgi:hypothetical protein
MESALFDINLLPLIEYRLNGLRDKLKTTEENKWARPVTHYDHFVSEGHEYVIVNIQSVLAGAEEVLKNAGFVTNFSPITNMEQTFLAYRPTLAKNTFKEKADIVMCVMVCETNSNQQIKDFIQYYQNQGVDRIFLYYCGELSEMPSYPEHKLVEYLEWNYNPFWIELNNKKVHYLQVPLYNMFLKKISMHCNWTIFCDLDEYIQSKTHKDIKDHLNQKQNHIFCDHKIAKICFDNKRIVYEMNSSAPNRGKSIIFGKKVAVDYKANVHRFAETEPDNNLHMYHDRRNSYKYLETVPALTAQL